MRATPGQKCAVSVTLGSLQQETGPSPVIHVVLVPSLIHQVRTAPGEVIIRIQSFRFEHRRRIYQEISRSNQETCSRQHLLLLLHSGPLRWQHQLNVLHVMWLGIRGTWSWSQQVRFLRSWSEFSFFKNSHAIASFQKISCGWSHYKLKYFSWLEFFMRLCGSVDIFLIHRLIGPSFHSSIQYASFMCTKDYCSLPSHHSSAENHILTRSKHRRYGQQRQGD